MHKEFNIVGPEYRTEYRKISLLSRTIPSAVFYLHMVMAVFRTAGKARHSKLDRVEWAKSGYSIIRSIEGVGVNIEISGLDNIKELDGQCIFVANHMSVLETFILPAMILPYKDLTFIIKRGLSEYPVFKHIMSSIEAIVVDRTNPRNDLVTVLREGVEKVNSGKSIVVFPQTTRRAIFDPKGFNTLGIKLAKRAGIPIIPIALKTDAWGCGTRILKDFGKIAPSLDVHFAFGKPLFISNRGVEEHKSIIDFIERNLKKWQLSGNQ